MKKGFTLAELLGVIVIIAVLAIISFPPIINQLNKSKENLSDATLKMIYSAAELFIDQHQNSYPLRNGDIYCVSLQDIVDADLLQAPIQDSKTGTTIPLTKHVQMTIGANRNITNKLIDSCTPHSGGVMN